MKEARRKQVFSKETLEKQRLSRLGRKDSKETIKKRVDAILVTKRNKKLILIMNSLIAYKINN